MATNTKRTEKKWKHVQEIDKDVTIFFHCRFLSLSTRLHVDAIVNTLYKNCVLLFIRVQYGMRESVACVACCIKKIIIRMDGDEKNTKMKMNAGIEWKERVDIKKIEDGKKGKDTKVSHTRTYLAHFLLSHRIELLMRRLSSHSMKFMAFWWQQKKRKEK